MKDEVCACVCIFIKQMHPINEYYYIIIILIQLILLDNDTYRIDEFIPRLKTRTVSRDDDVGGAEEEAECFISNTE